MVGRSGSRVVKAESMFTFLRSQYDAVLIGVGTFLEDNPKLNVRLSDDTQKENYAIVLDPTGSGLTRLRNSELVTVRENSKIIWVVSDDVDAPSDIVVIKVSRDEDGLDLEELLHKLTELKIQSVFVEGGARTYGSFLNQNLVNRIYHYTAKVDVSENNMLYWLSYVSGELNSTGPIDKKGLGQDEFQSFLLRRP